MKYRILESGNIEELEQQVNGQIDNGWKPLGGVCRSDDETYCHYVQAVIKE